MKPISVDDVRQALADAVAEDGDVEVRVDMEPVVRTEMRLAPPTVTEAVSALEEDEMFREFAGMLGLAEDQKPVRMVSLPTAEYEALKAEADRLPELIRDWSRPDDWSAEAELQYRRWALDVGLE